MSESEVLADETIEAVCTRCGVSPHRAIKFYAPEGEEGLTWEVFKKSFGGAVLWGAAGATFGAPGAVVGGALGWVVLGVREWQNQPNQIDHHAAHMECTECGNEVMVELDKRDDEPS